MGNLRGAGQVAVGLQLLDKAMASLVQAPLKKPPPAVALIAVVRLGRSPVLLAGFQALNG